MPLTQEEIETRRQEHERHAEAERDFVSGLIDAAKLWQHCEHRVRRRMRSCVETHTCQTTRRGSSA